mmetsp:Transcript_22961/g.52632  ORF Transcript_22961/g.52632 Transcript_22961/m.52632 type:complete len:83 (+) Transcript_22961:188-436(+)
MAQASGAWLDHVREQTLHAARWRWSVLVVLCAWMLNYLDLTFSLCICRRFSVAYEKAPTQATKTPDKRMHSQVGVTLTSKSI